MNAYSQILPGSDAGDFTVIQFLIAASLANVQTVSIVQVVAVDTVALTVDVQVLANIMTSGGQSIPHGTIHKRPYYRAQGGTSGIILDPAAGDNGVMVFASRDSSAVIASKSFANPGTSRVFDWADGIYLGGILNAAPSQYLKFDSGGVTIVSPTAVTIQAPTITLDGDVHITGSTVGDGDGTFDGTDVHTHTHGGVQSGGSDTGPPV